jgi:imidazolonepropionase
LDTDKGNRKIRKPVRADFLLKGAGSLVTMAPGRSKSALHGVIRLASCKTPHGANEDDWAGLPENIPLQSVLHRSASYEVRRGPGPSETEFPVLLDLTEGATEEYGTEGEIVERRVAAEYETEGEDEGLGVIRDGAVVAFEGTIIATGTTGDIKEAIDRGAIELEEGATVIDAPGCLVTPGLVDPHTHLLFSGWRAEEFALRLKGASYLDILARGGGIMDTVRATRMAPEEDLYALGMKHLDSMLLSGTTTVEVKSGYGLTTEDELKLLRVARKMGQNHPVDVVSTFLGAHAIPEEFAGNKEAYIELLSNEMMPRVLEEHLADFVDVFCEEGVFSVDQSRRILNSARNHGFKLKLHADEMSPLGGAVLAAEVGAVSADHLVMVDDLGIRRMAEKQVSAVLLPGTSFFLMADKYAPARRFVEQGVPIALATDFNPGTCTIESLALIMAIACLRMKISPAEALRACTLGAARALSREEEIGSLEAGKMADIVIFDAPSFHHLPYRFGANLVKGVVKKGKIVVKDGCLTR